MRILHQDVVGSGKSTHPLSKPILSRYETTAAGEIIIDVAAARVQDLYNDFDRNAPYVRRDLDQDPC